MGSDGLLSRFGEPEGVYRPSRGQTFAGVLVCLGGAAGFALAAAGGGLDATNRVCAALLGAAALGLGGWLYRQRRWRLVLFSGGLVQVRPGGVDEGPWPEVREVVEPRVKGRGDRAVRVTVMTAAGRVVVDPVNYRSRDRLFVTLLAAAGRHGIPTRVEWEEVD